MGITGGMSAIGPVLPGIPVLPGMLVPPTLDDIVP